MSRIPESFQSGGEQRRRFFSANRRSGSLFLGHEKARKKISRSRTALNRRALSRSTRGSCSEPSIVGPAAVERIAVRRDHGEKRPEKTEGERNEARGGASEQRDGKKQATTTARALELARLVSYLFLFDCNLWFSFFSFSLPPLSLSHPLLPLLLPLSLSYSLNQATSGNRTDVVAKKKINVAINGFGRIGRNFLRCVEGRGPDSLLNVTVINDSGGVKQASHLLKYDSTLGTFNADVQASSTTRPSRSTASRSRSSRRATRPSCRGRPRRSTSSSRARACSSRARAPASTCRPGPRRS